jgi:hypothetical protein
MASVTKNIEYRIQNIAQRCHTLSAKLINKEQIIISLQMLCLVASTSNPEFQQRYLRWALIAYNRALKDNALPVDKDLRRVYGETYSPEEMKEMETDMLNEDERG